MNRRQSERILGQVLSLPTAPFAEHHVLDYIRSFVAARSTVTARTDAAGNILVHYQHGRQRVPRPICLAAHTDHPGFVAQRMLSSKKLQALWRGGVRPQYFPGSRVRFFSEGEWVRGRITSIGTTGRGPRTTVKNAVIDVPARVAPDSPGMWDLPEPAVRNKRIYARAIDDLAGVAAMLACIHDIDARRQRGQAYFLFTRAEEVGFVGAMAACKAKTIPKRCVVIAIETSSQRPHARMGDGPILRVGDKSSMFTPSATAFAGAVAEDLAQKKKRFTYQRKLMDGGTCESSAYCALGYDATGICVALGNYHNMNVTSKRIGAEYIDLDDFARLAEWFVALVETRRRYNGQDPTLSRKLETLQREFNPLLRKTARP
ncbi:MAG: M20/M25/M40 family metallo-hydrolase [Phycisphaerae bacterium]